MKNKIDSLKEKKTMLTFFIILFPSMIITILTTIPPTLFYTLLALALFCYQAILLKNFIEKGEDDF